MNCCAAVAPASPRTQGLAAASVAEAGTSDKAQDLETTGDKKRTRKKKDPAAPKKALTGYLVYINNKREQVIKEHPEADLVEQVNPHTIHLKWCVIHTQWFSTARDAACSDIGNCCKFASVHKSPQLTVLDVNITVQL